MRCEAIAASPQLGVRRAQLRLGRAGRSFLSRGRQVATFAFPADRWRRAASGECRNATGHQRLDLKVLARLSPSAPLKVRAWTDRGLRSTTQGTLADLLAALNAGPAHLTLRLLSSSEGVRLAWGQQEPDPGLQAPLGVLTSTNTPPRAVSTARRGALLGTSPQPCAVSTAGSAVLPSTNNQSDARGCAGTGRGGMSTEPHLGNAPREAQGKAPLTSRDTCTTAVFVNKARVQSNLLQGGTAPLIAKGRPTGKCRPSLKGLFLVLELAGVTLLFLAWLAFLEDEEAEWTHPFLLAFLCLAGSLPAACKMCTRLRLRLRQLMEAREDDIVFLGRRIPFLREEEMSVLDGGSFLGRGGNACVRRLLYRGMHAVRKEFLHQDTVVLPMMREARLMLELHGAGGVPRPLALGFHPLTIIQEFVGEPYDKFLRQCSVQDMLRSLHLLCHRLGELHAQYVVHNDLKTDNITVSGDVHRPVLHVIDLGWACRVGHVAGDFTLETGKDDAPTEGFANECPWMAPEVRARRPVFPSGDVFSLGFLLQDLAADCIQPWLAVPLWRLGQRCCREDPSCRPSLHEVALASAAMEEELLQCQLQEPFHLVARC